MQGFLRRHFLPLLVLSVVASQLGIAIVVALVVGNHFNDVQTTTQHNQDTSLVQACDRLNTLAATMNSNSYADYELLRTSRGSGVFQSRLTAAIHATAWTPHTDCIEVVYKAGNRFRAPPPVRFDDQLPPPNALRH